MATLKGQKILITGPTGQVAKPLARALAADNEVWGIARFKDPATRAAVEADGVHCVAADLSAGDFSAVPDDFNYVLNLAVSKSGDFDYDLAANVEALGLLMSHCRSAQALLHCSSTAVYQANGHHRFAENDPLGDNHRVMMPTYSLAKIAAESMAKYVAREYQIPTTIARLNVPYGDNGGWPSYHFDAMLANQPIAVHTDGPSVYNPIHEDDIIRQVPALLDDRLDPGHGRQLGRQRRGEHRGLVPVHGRAGRRRAPLRVHRPGPRKRHHRHHPHARTGRYDDR